jgi:hypothetical protein
MNFAVIGSNPAALALLRQLLDSAEHRLFACLPAGRLLDELTAAGLSVPVVDSAEHLLPESDLHVIVLALDDCDEILRLTRAAVQADKHVAVMLPDSGVFPALAFELQLIQDESQMSVIPVNGRWQLRDVGSLEHLDPQQVRQLSLSRTVSAVDTESLTRAMREGIDCLCAAGFAYSQVTVLDSTLPDGRLLRRLVTLGTHAEADIRLPAATLTLTAAESAHSEEEDVLSLVNAEGVEQKYPAGPPDFLHWLVLAGADRQAAREMLGQCSVTLELMEAAAKSLRRRRTVDVHFDSGSERSLFKSQMTAIGCLVLTWMLIGMMVWLIIGQLVELPAWFWFTARIVWLGPMVFFLLAQLLLPLARERRRS